MLQTFRVEKVDEKMESSCRAIVLKLSKKVHFFLQFCADRSKKSKSIKQFTYIRLKNLVTFRKWYCLLC